MPTEFTLPDLGEGIESGDVVDVLVSVGDTIAVDQDILEVETEKAVIPVPSSVAGVVEKIHVNKGDTIPIGAAILSVAAGGDQPEQHAQAEAQHTEEQESRAAAATTPSESSNAAANGSTVATSTASEPVSPSSPPAQAAADHKPPTSAGDDDHPAPAGPDTRRYARELGVDLSRITGTGEGGRITREDVRRSVQEAMSQGSPTTPPARQTSPAAQPATRDGKADSDEFGSVHISPLPRIRQAIARNMARSASAIPHVTNFDDADITELNLIRKSSSADYGDVKLTMMPFVIKACALALKRHPEINATLDLDNNQIIYKDYVNIGIAVDTPRGLVVPVMQDAVSQSIPNLARGLAVMADSARDGKFSLEDLKGGSFTISNLGAIGGTYSTPIINYPEVAILLLGRSRKLPVVTRDDEVEIRLMMPLSLSYDHRLVDGAAAARFLNEVKDYLQNPGRLLLAP
ncbi:MAG: 2-oxo acid dehydrogenase subunit E2 [Pirellulales bacterium]|nr:2-oxo acid dehydrogenase subunit E2 [Pirellulales bacterium]